jgi:hypothetical protein
MPTSQHFIACELKLLLVDDSGIAILLNDDAQLFVSLTGYHQRRT